MNMNKETYEVSKDEAQTLNIEELIRHSSTLTTRLQLARKEIDGQRRDLERLRESKLALRLELADANSEIGRLVTALTHEAEQA
ncbi:MAG TPA: hypothetical protein VKC56_03380 [Gallionellaceae bacterium]|nr:hypothetical protein [Gallionellaceae bacterium]